MTTTGIQISSWCVLRLLFIIRSITCPLSAVIAPFQVPFPPSFFILLLRSHNEIYPSTKSITFGIREMQILFLFFGGISWQGKCLLTSSYCFSVQSFTFGFSYERYKDLFFSFIHRQVFELDRPNIWFMTGLGSSPQSNPIFEHKFPFCSFSFWPDGPKWDFH